MKKKLKIVIFFLVFLALIIFIYILTSNIIYSNINSNKNNSNEYTYERIEKDGLIFLLIYKDSSFSFGSGHKYLYIFSKNKILLGRCKFGELPLTIKEITEDKLFIDINSSSNIDYQNIWKKRNKRIWKYKIVYFQ